MQSFKKNKISFKNLNTILSLYHLIVVFMLITFVNVIVFYFYLFVCLRCYCIVYNFSSRIVLSRFFFFAFFYEASAMHFDFMQ